MCKYKPEASIRTFTVKKCDGSRELQSVSNVLIIDQDYIAMITFAKDEIHWEFSVNQTVYAADKLAAAADEINSLTPVA